MSQSSGKAAPSIRARVRAEMVDEIKRVALEHLAVDGAALSLRAVARDMGMVSSALYRYFPSRDDLLTALIIDAYNSLGEACELGDAAVRERGDFHGRWLAAGHAIRDWAVERPHEYALIYGSPVPGYQAPMDTIEPSNRPYALFAGILADTMAAAMAAGEGGTHGAHGDDSKHGDPALAEKLSLELAQASAYLDIGPPAQPADVAPDPHGPPPVMVARAFLVFAQLFGAVSFEIFGRLNNVIDERRDWFDWQLRSMAAYLGLSPRP
jgi:AcrR family transcriptional regulator